jgi:hypothetical protein
VLSVSISRGIALMMEAVGTSEASVNYQTSLHNILMPLWELETLPCNSTDSQERKLKALAPISSMNCPVM